jgi:hypothetical protein
MNIKKNILEVIYKFFYLVNDRGSFTGLSWILGRLITLSAWVKPAVF